MPQLRLIEFDTNSCTLTETQPDSKNSDVKVRNETHALIINSTPGILEKTPEESRTHDVQAITEVFFSVPDAFSSFSRLSPIGVSDNAVVKVLIK